MSCADGGVSFSQGRFAIRRDGGNDFGYCGSADGRLCFDMYRIASVCGVSVAVCHRSLYDVYVGVMLYC